MPELDSYLEEVVRAIEGTFGSGRAVLDLDLAAMCTYRVGGPARVAFFPASPEELAQAIGMLSGMGRRFEVLGRGSNVLVSESGIPDPLLVLTEMNAISVTGVSLKAQAGADCTEMAASALEAGLTGLEFMCGLPGSAGGAAFMNARAFGQEVAQVLVRARVVTREGRLLSIEPQPSDFGYKRSPFMDQGLCVAEVELKLASGDAAEIRSRMEANARHRRSKGEMDHPCCGCVFKNPPDSDRSAGALIDGCGLKGARQGGAWVSDRHANFVVHDGRATPSDIRALMERVREEVARRTGRTLEYEVRFLGKW